MTPAKPTPDAIAAMYRDVFTDEELAAMRRDVQLCKVSFVVCAEIERRPDEDQG